MRVPVLYGQGERGGFRSEVDYIFRRFSWNFSESWDGLAEAEFPDVPVELKQELLSFLEPEELDFSPEERYRHSLGKSSPEILMAKHGKITRIVDAVVYPKEGRSQQILSELHRRGFNATIYGGGTSVSGSLLLSGKKNTVSIDTRNFRKFILRNNIAIVGSGLRGVEAERAANRNGFTLGNFPESFIYSTIGGWVSTKATGQESNYYGGIEDLILGVKMETSSGSLQDDLVPRESSGMQPRDLSLGSDGRNGLITEVAMKTFPMPEGRYYNSRVYGSFYDGIASLSRMKIFPAVARLSDETETEFALMGAGDSSALKLFRGYIKLRGYSKGSLLVIVNNNRAVLPDKKGSISTGSGPAKSWEKGRYSRPGFANILWKSGLVPDTLETSATWENIWNLYAETKKAFYSLRQEKGFGGEIMAHLSHLYREGACIYFTFIIKGENELELLQELRDKLIRTFMSNGGSVTHHHGKGRFFLPYMDSFLLKAQESYSDPLLGGER